MIHGKGKRKLPLFFASNYDDLFFDFSFLRACFSLMVSFCLPFSFPLSRPLSCPFAILSSMLILQFLFDKKIISKTLILFNLHFILNGESGQTIYLIHWPQALGTFEYIEAIVAEKMVYLKK